jgi:hypothetical protein
MFLADRLHFLHVVPTLKAGRRRIDEPARWPEQALGIDPPARRPVPPDKECGNVARTTATSEAASVMP